MQPFLFISDLDNTLVGDDQALAELNQHLQQCRQENSIKIVYATGRSLFLYRQLTEEKELLKPDFLIAAVGTAIYEDPAQDDYDSEWANHLAEGWNREQVVEIAAKYSQLNPQEDYKQNPFKVSFYIDEAAAEKIIPQLQTELNETGLRVNIIYSGSIDLDLLPERAHKGFAVEFLRNKLGFTPENTVVCGDSGNDIALFAIAQAKGILVGNAKSELRKWYEENAQEQHYLAQAECAGGILEGLKQFDFL